MEQNRSASQNRRMPGAALARPFPQPRRLAFRAFALAVCAVLAAVCATFAVPSGTAHADSYTMPKVDITAQAETDGSLHVVEQRTFSFDGDFSAVWWTFGDLPDGAELQVNAARMVPVDEAGEPVGEPETLERAPFVLSWRDEGGPGHDAYSVDVAKDTVYVFFDGSEKRLLVELDYTVKNGVQAYADVGEVYWKFVGEQWGADSSNVTLTLALPVPSGATVEPGVTVRAWGHGPLDGAVGVNGDGSVTYTVPNVEAGDYAEARVVFPESWLTNLPSGTEQTHRTEKHLEDALAEEQAWADSANAARVASLAFIIAAALVCVAALAVGLWAYFRYGKEHVPAFKDDYWRDVPSPSVHPAEIGRLWRWDHASSDDFTATLMHLSCTGGLRIDRAPAAEDGSAAEGYVLTRLPGAEQAASHPLDREALRILFDVVAEGRDAVRFDELSAYGAAHPQEFKDALDGWQGMLSAQVNKRAFFEYEGSKWQFRIIALAVVLAVAAVLAWIWAGNLFPVVFAIPTVVALALLGNHTSRRSVEGNELCAKCKALRNWLRDFSTLDERPPTDVKVWGAFMVYAYLFGIADKVVDELKVTMPQLFGDEVAMGPGYTLLPWWYWYAASTGHAAGAPAGGLFQASLDETMRSAQAALSATPAGSGFSGIGGGGGGFSIGGGGGFSSGGGAR